MAKQSVVKQTKYNSVQRMNPEEIRQKVNSFSAELDSNPQFSLEVDPLRKYNFDQLEVDFIQEMVQWKNVRFVATCKLKIDEQEANQIYRKFEVQQEIRRINLAMYCRRFNTKMATLDDIGGFLTTALTDEFVPMADRLSGKDKLTAAKLLMDLNKLQSEAIQKPEAIDVVAIEADMKKLCSVKDIEALIENEENPEKIMDKKDAIIAELDPDGQLSQEEISYLKTQTTKELEKLLREVKKGLKKNEANKEQTK